MWQVLTCLQFVCAIMEGDIPMEVNKESAKYCRLEMDEVVGVSLITILVAFFYPMCIRERVSVGVCACC